MCGCHAAVQFEPPKAARPPGQRTGGFCQLVSVVSRLLCQNYRNFEATTINLVLGREFLKRLGIPQVCRVVYEVEESFQVRPRSVEHQILREFLEDSSL